MEMDQQTVELLDELRAGVSEAIGGLFELYRDRLWRMLAVRLDRRLAASRCGKGGKSETPEELSSGVFR